MPATIDRPPAIPAPPGARCPFVAPAPTWACGECGGEAHDPDFEVPCQSCLGCGLEPAAFLLPPSRSHERRAVKYQPACGLLTVAQAVKAHRRDEVATYDVSEAACDGPGRLFLLRKHGPEGRKHETYVGPDGVNCSCEANVYVTSAKHNQRAYEVGDEVFPTHGCVHADSCVALLLAGWFDL